MEPLMPVLFLTLLALYALFGTNGPSQFDPWDSAV